MASAVPTSLLNDMAKGNVDFDTDTFKRMLISAVPAVETFKDSWAKRSDVTNEVTGTGYTAGGAACTITVPAIDTTNNRQDITLGSSSWGPGATITNSAGSVVYKSRGGAANLDELCFLNDFGGTVPVSNGTLTHNADTIRFAN